MKRFLPLLLILPLLIWIACEESEETDTIPPTVIITSPQDGSIVSDSVEITCMSTDDKGVEMVELWVNGVSTGVADSTEPYSLKWITSDIEHGNYTIIVRAYDLNGNAADSNPIILTVSNLSDYNLFTATFDGEFDNTVTSFIFISDDNGNILADSGFIGDASFDLIADKSSNPPPDKINVTILTQKDGYIDIQTNLGINKGSNWTWYNPYYEPEVIGESYYTFSNIPAEFYRVVLSSKGLTNRTSINESDTYSLSHYNNNEDVVIMGIMNDGTALYKFIENVSVSDTHSVDFSNFTQATQKIINNLTGEDCSSIHINGLFLDDSFVNYNRYGLNRGWNEGIDWNDENNFVVNYPPEFTKFRTKSYNGAPYSGTIGEKTWVQTITGDIPESIEKINADINVLSSDIEDFEMDLSGSYDQWTISAIDSLTNNRWDIFVNPSITSGRFPMLPQSVIDIYPDINRNSFEIVSVGMSDFLCAENQEEWHELYFNTDGYYGDFCSGYKSVHYWLE